jgi:hypothetical protein
MINISQYLKQLGYKLTTYCGVVFCHKTFGGVNSEEGLTGTV